MEDGNVDATVIESQPHQLGQMADFLPFLTSSVFDLKKFMYLKLNLRHAAQTDEFS